ncbi:MAG: hypothetical protein FD133_106 [Erysipelotrichaceae bacterium]|nr:MAG: hypothetical protein FD179_1798 [Erysipelotrichaceae bacterium]TXT19987.1 MAG: hypothetical protein FD133_106 [Erysipelotrichaceae bacterium]
MNKIVFLWKSDNPIDVRDMILPYIINSIKKKWWDEVEVIIWGASQQFVADNEDVQLDIAGLLADGAKIYACRSCADSLCLIDKLTQLGIDVQATGKMLTDRLQSDVKVLVL